MRLAHSSNATATRIADMTAVNATCTALAPLTHVNTVPELVTQAPDVSLKSSVGVPVQPKYAGENSLVFTTPAPA